MRGILLAGVLTITTGAATAAEVGPDLDALLETLAISGREERAAERVLARLPEGSARRDRLGNVVVELGEGKPRRLVVCGLDEPGVVVSEIRPDGYLRLRRTGGAARGALWMQGYQGQKVWIQTAAGRVAGAVAIPSIHLFQGPRGEPATVGQDDLFVDVGAETAGEVREQGIRMLDPVGLYHRSTAYGEDLRAGPAAMSKAACAALLDATRRLAAGSVDGSLVVGFVGLELWNRKALEHLVGELGPFDEVLLASRGFGWSRRDEGVEPAELPPLGSGALATGDATLPGAVGDVAHLPPSSAWYTGGPDWEEAAVGYFSVPSRYRETAVETVALADVEALASALVAWGGAGGDPPPPARLLAPEAVVTAARGHEEAALLLGRLVGSYGVSTREEDIRSVVERALPAWAEPEVDGRGNLIVELGSGEEHVAFVAHLDEVGFLVEAILDDGRLALQVKGGLALSAWEAQTALVHTLEGPVAGVFEPRPAWLESELAWQPEALTVSIGVDSRAAAEAAGVAPGDAVTMPKRMLRLGRHRAVARSFDDRVGSTAQLLALARIDPARLRRRVTFAWVVEEEIGLFGSLALAGALEGLDRVHPVDTFVSSDDPHPPKGFALAPLGEGVVLRAMDNGYLAERSAIEHAERLATARGIPVRVGFTGGGNDGIAFIDTGAVNLPLSWPGRYSHSPAEVMDLRDLGSLVELIVALVEE